MARSDEPQDAASLHREEALCRLADELLRRLGREETLDRDALAAEFGLDPRDVQRCMASVQLMAQALGPVEADAAPPSELPAPELPEDYELLDELGRGGMGVVYRARQRSLDRIVAVKVLRPGELIFGEAIRRFKREARSLARICERVTSCDRSL